MEAANIILLAVIELLSLAGFAMSVYLGWVAYVSGKSESGMAVVDEIIKVRRGPVLIPRGAALGSYYDALVTFEYHDELVQSKITFLDFKHASHEIGPGLVVPVQISFDKHGKMWVLAWKGSSRFRQVLGVFGAVVYVLEGLLFQVVFFMAMSAMFGSHWSAVEFVKAMERECGLEPCGGYKNGYIKAR